MMSTTTTYSSEFDTTKTSLDFSWLSSIPACRSRKNIHWSTLPRVTSGSAVISSTPISSWPQKSFRTTSVTTSTTNTTRSNKENVEPITFSTASQPASGSSKSQCDCSSSWKAPKPAVRRYKLWMLSLTFLTMAALGYLVLCSRQLGLGSAYLFLTKTIDNIMWTTHMSISFVII